jgi:ribosomal protein S6
MEEMSQVEAQAETSSQANTPKDSRPIYEIGFHIVPTVEEVKVGEVVDTLKSEITKAGVEIAGEQFPAKLTLAYVVERATSGKREKYTESYFGWIKFIVEERAGIPLFESFLQHNKEILRYLLVETKREEVVVPRRAIFSSNRLNGRLRR